MGQLVSSWIGSGVRGRPNRKSNTYARVNKQTGKVSIVQVLNPYQGQASELQNANRKRFGLVSKSILQWMREGQINDDVTYLKAVNEYRQQHEVGNFLGWCIKKIPDMREGHCGLEHRAIVRGWINVDER